MPLKNNLLLIITLPLFWIACKSDRRDVAENSEDLTSEQNFPEGFESFFTRFHSDSLYQLEHIVFPLEGKNDAVDPERAYYWTPDNWKLHGEYDESLTDFSRSFRVVKDIVIEIIQDKYAFSRMERRFAKIDGEWMLIYYGISTSG